MTSDPHDRFDRIAEAYAMRPSYPDAAIDWLVAQSAVAPGDPALDLGAGTGLLSAALAVRGLEVTSAEPSAPMRAELEHNVPAARAVADRAESLSAADGAFALVTAGQAFHWFDTVPALTEIHRALRPGGRLAVAWIVPDTADPLQAKIQEVSWSLLEREQIPGPMPGEPLGWEPWFEDTRSAEFPFTRTIPGSALPEYVSSFSVVAILDDAERADVLADAATWADPGDELVLPYRAQIHLGRRRDAVSPAPT